ncbi:MAG: hypothetical protein AABX38_00325 [Candidatus Micrarchaeota archaeon]
MKYARTKALIFALCLYAPSCRSEQSRRMLNSAPDAKIFKVQKPMSEPRKDLKTAVPRLVYDEESDKALRNFGSDLLSFFSSPSYKQMDKKIEGWSKRAKELQTDSNSKKKEEGIKKIKAEIEQFRKEMIEQGLEKTYDVFAKKRIENEVLGKIAETGTRKVAASPKVTY